MINLSAAIYTQLDEYAELAEALKAEDMGDPQESIMTCSATGIAIEDTICGIAESHDFLETLSEEAIHLSEDILSFTGRIREAVVAYMSEWRQGMTDGSGGMSEIREWEYALYVTDIVEQAAELTGHFIAYAIKQATAEYIARLAETGSAEDTGMDGYITIRYIRDSVDED